MFSRDINRKFLLHAIRRNELDSFLEGRGVYTFGFNQYAPGDSYLNLSCAMPVIYRYYEEDPESRVDLLLEKALLDWLTWKSGIGVYAVFSVMKFQLVEEYKNEAPFKLNKEKILPELRKAAVIYEEDLKLRKEYEGASLKEGLWESMQWQNERVKEQYGIEIL